MVVYDWFNLISNHFADDFFLCVLDIQNYQWNIQVWNITKIKPLGNNIFYDLADVYTSEGGREVAL